MSTATATANPPPKTALAARPGATVPGQQLVTRRPPLVDKAAIVIMALDDDRSQKLLSRLTEDEVRRLSTAMATLGRTDLETVERAVTDFRAEVGRTCNIQGGAEATERMLRRFLPPEKVAEIMDEIKGPHGKNIWEKLSHIQPQMLAGYLRNEFPQTAAVILARLPAPHAARVLKLLPNRLSADIAVRLVRMNSIQRSVLTDIEETLKREFTSELARSYERDSASIMAEMLNRSEADVVERVLAALEEKEPQAAARIRRIMFTFEDLRRIDPTTFGVLIAECPAEKLPLALSNASETLRELFMSRMSERAGKMLLEEMDTMPPARRRQVDEAQAEIITLAKRLIDDGRVVLLEAEEEEQQPEF
jgi:flagellar motor switch protein FliG